MDIAARAMGLQIQVFNTSTSREIDVAFEAFARERPESPQIISEKIRARHGRRRGRILCDQHRRIVAYIVPN